MDFLDKKCVGPTEQTTLSGRPALRTSNDALEMIVLAH